VATTTPAGLAAIPDGVRQRSAVRIDLPPWSEADVAAFVAFALDRAGADADCFSEPAVETLARFAAGVPRVATRLARLAAVAAAGEGLDRVDAGTVERAWRELMPDHESPRPATAPPSASPIRPVRKLFG
jgi:Holliday junction resolvasome RuvABC ATP-dependent DNA helicase subunit